MSNDEDDAGRGVRSTAADNEQARLRERAKELDCLYRVEEILARDAAPLEEVLAEVALALPGGWQYPQSCRARIICRDHIHADPGFAATPWILSAPILLYGDTVGAVEVVYTRGFPEAAEGPFLQEERRLLDSIAARIGGALIRRSHSTMPGRTGGGVENLEWRTVISFLERTDRPLFGRVTRKMINFLAWSGIEEGRGLLQRYGPIPVSGESTGEENRPAEKQVFPALHELAGQVFALAAERMGDDQIASCIQQWIKEEKVSFLKHAVEDPNADLGDLSDALDRFAQTEVTEQELSIAARRGLRVNLTRRFLTDQLSFINIAKRYLSLEDFSSLVSHMIVPPRSHGQLGGKASGLFLAASILRQSPVHKDLLSSIKTPRSWHIPSGGIRAFINYNNLEDLYNQKYLEIDQVRREYPHIIQLFKNSHFPPEMMRGMLMALEDLGTKPLIVRSSSLLEDRIGAVFSGKYKSLFLANQGPREQRLEALMDAVAEIYASLFGPDPIEYRAERGLLDVREEMGILIQEVVGRRVGRYFLPAFAGVAFSSNEFRWSPRIDRDDGLVRLVPGLGTRAVDRTAADYPVLLAPGRPNLQVNVTPDEVVRYSPRSVDVINMDEGVFETVPLRELLTLCRGSLPGVNQMVSRLEGDRLTQPLPFQVDYAKDELVCTFRGLIDGGRFVELMTATLKELREKMGFPVDIEFAHDGESFYLLQCRAQSSGSESEAAPIPQDVPEEKVLFTASRHVSNGAMPEITHLVYIDPAEYERLDSLELLRETGRVVGRLNRLLPKRRFVLIGPGRWGSRGDIKLGVNVTYSDINNTAALIEVGWQKKDYRPELSFGTHFFQDLVEADIRYLPLYPDDPGIRFHEAFFRRSPNILAQLLPDDAHLEQVVKVIDLPAATGGLILRVLLNAELDQAMGMLATPAAGVGPTGSGPVRRPREGGGDHWRWRQRVAEKVAETLEGERHGVKGLYLFGSVKNASAGPGSDIDLLVHFAGTPTQKRLLESWFQGWSLCLGEMNYLRTGYRNEGLLDVHFVTDQDVASRSSYAAKIGAVTDAARPLRIYE